MSIPTAIVSGATAPTPKLRLASIDAYRGFVMLLMMAEVLDLGGVSKNLPDRTFWRILASAQTHVEWVGCSLHDLIQPSFSFLVGVALPFSLESRLRRGQSLTQITLHTLWRSTLLILLGVFLRSIGHDQTVWTFEDTLTQIGLGYPVLFFFGLHSTRVRWIGLAAILVAYWAAWAIYPAPDGTLDNATQLASTVWTHDATGFAAHWNKHANLGVAFERWFLNLFPRPSPFIANEGGYLTLSFIPTLGTMILGLIAGSWLRHPLTNEQRVRRLVAVGISALVLGISLHLLGVCPIVKRIWTPSWTLFSGGFCFLLLALFYFVVDWHKKETWVFPMVVIGVNSIAAYCMAHLFEDFLLRTLDTHLGTGFFSLFGEPYLPLGRGAAVLGILWLILFWMYRRSLFLKISHLTNRDG